MPNVGIIAEYNPFHNGHAYNITQARLVSGCSNVIVCMSGSFVQRGEPACFDKFTRAKHALLGGADLVIEMPDILSCASAERFAFGGVRLLTATGIIDSIAFGSECGDIEKLKQAASCDIRSEEVRGAIAGGQTYARAVANSINENDGSDHTLAPNDILAVEYLRSIKNLAPSISAFIITRIGSGYNDAVLGSVFASATAIRETVIQKGAAPIEPYVPSFVFEDVCAAQSNGAFPSTLDGLNDPALFVMRKLGIGGIETLADVSEGLENLFYRSACSSSSIKEMLSQVKSKRYTMARLKRIAVSAMLGSTKELLKTSLECSDALYIRVLGVRRGKLNLLSELSKNSLLPVVTSFADTAKLSDNAKKVLTHSRSASCIRSLGCPSDKSAADDFSHPLIVV